MNHETMTVHSALCELKMLDKRIQKKIRETSFCANVRHSLSKINGKPISEYEKSVQEAYDSIVGMIARRKAIRNALSLSNAKTMVRIQGVEYTVAEAIEMRKSGIENETVLMENLRESFTACKTTAERENGEKLTSKADEYVRGLYGSKEKVNSEEVNAVRDTYIAQNTIDFIDPLNAEKKLQALSQKLDTFESEVDAALSVSNATTMIEIDY